MKTKKLICTLTAMLMVNGTTMNVLGATGDTPVTYTYNETSASQPFEYDDEVFGKAQHYKDGTSGSVKLIKETNYKNSYYYLDQYVYVIYKYDRRLNAAYKLMEEYVYVTPNSETTLTASLTETISKTYEETLNESISKTAAAKATASAGKTPLEKIELQASAEATESVSTTIAMSHNYTYIKGYTNTTTLAPSEEERSFSWEIRCDYNVYFVSTYEIKYEEHKTKKNTWYGKKYSTYSYTVAGLEYVESMYCYQAIKSTSQIGFFPYEKTENGYIYSGTRYSFCTYLD